MTLHHHEILLTYWANIKFKTTNKLLDINDLINLKASIKNPIKSSFTVLKYNRYRKPILR